MLPQGVRLIHLRHGETDWNVEGRLQGQLDIPLNDTGRGQAHRNGRTLRDWLAAEGIALNALDFVASPLSRSSETMTIARSELGLDASFPTDDRLKEVAFGEWSGFTYEELKNNGQRDRVKARKKDKWGFRPPGGETYGELAARVGAWLETLERDTVAVTHGGVFRVLHGHLCDRPWHEVPGLPAPQDRFSVFVDGTVTLI